MKAGYTDGFGIYSATKFIQLLGAHWWQRQLQGICQVVAVSPGLIPHTGLGRHSDIKMDTSMPGGKPISEGTKHVPVFLKGQEPAS